MNEIFNEAEARLSSKIERLKGLDSHGKLMRKLGEVNETQWERRFKSEHMKNGTVPEQAASSSF